MDRSVALRGANLRRFISVLRSRSELPRPSCWQFALTISRGGPWPPWKVRCSKRSISPRRAAWIPISCWVRFLLSKSMPHAERPYAERGRREEGGQKGPISAGARQNSSENDWSARERSLLLKLYSGVPVERWPVEEFWSPSIRDSRLRLCRQPVAVAGFDFTLTD